MTNETKRIVWLYFAFQFFFSLLFWLPIFDDYQRRVGLNDTQIFNIQSIYYIVFCFLEIPTGLLADLIGYRVCMLLGSVVLVIANLVPVYFWSYEAFIFHWILIALARSFISGAASAYIYNYLQHHDLGASYKQVEGNARAYGLFGKVFCWSVIGKLMDYHLTLPYWLTAVAAAISVYCAYILPPALQVESRPSKVGHLGGVFRGFVKSPYLFLIMLQGIAIFVLARVCQVNLFQPILRSKGMGAPSFGVVMGVMTAWEAIGSAKVDWFRRYFSDLNAVFILTAVMAGSLLAVPYTQAIGTIVSLSVFAYVTGLSYPIQRQLLNDAIEDSSHRATLLSVESIIDRAANAVLASMMGGYLARGMLSQFLVQTSIGTLAGMAFLFLVMLPLQARRKS
jgi:MFS family permease